MLDADRQVGRILSARCGERRERPRLHWAERRQSCLGVDDDDRAGRLAHRLPADGIQRLDLSAPNGPVGRVGAEFETDLRVRVVCGHSQADEPRIVAAPDALESIGEQLDRQVIVPVDRIRHDERRSRDLGVRLLAQADDQLERDLGDDRVGCIEMRIRLARRRLRPIRRLRQLVVLEASGTGRPGATSTNLTAGVRGNASRPRAGGRHGDGRIRSCADHGARRVLDSGPASADMDVAWTAQGSGGRGRGRQDAAGDMGDRGAGRARQGSPDGDRPGVDRCGASLLRHDERTNTDQGTPDEPDRSSSPTGQRRAERQQQEDRADERQHAADLAGDAVERAAGGDPDPPRRWEAGRVVGGHDHVVQALDRTPLAGAHAALDVALVGETGLRGDRQRPELRVHRDVPERSGARSGQDRLVVDADDDGLGRRRGRVERARR